MHLSNLNADIMGWLSLETIPRMSMPSLGLCVEAGKEQMELNAGSPGQLEAQQHLQSLTPLRRV
jgi:hypothetical protein